MYASFEESRGVPESFRFDWPEGLNPPAGDAADDVYAAMGYDKAGPPGDGEAVSAGWPGDAAAEEAELDDLFGEVYPSPGQAAAVTELREALRAREAARFARRQHRHDNTLTTGPDPAAAGIAASRARQRAADPAGPASWSLDEVYDALYGE